MNELIASSAAMRELLGAALDVAPTPTTVLITEAAAVDQALQHRGTVLIDELSALTHDAQAKLLALLEAPHSSRVIATSNRAPSALLDRGALRSDLYYRLDVYPLHVPALRERREDLAQLADKLLTRIAAGLGRTPFRLTGAALAALEGFDWPGNVRELANVLERSAIRAKGPLLDAADLPIEPRRNSPSPFPEHLPLDLEHLERLAIGEALRRTGGNRTHAARLLNIGVRTLRQKLNGPSRASVMDEAPAPLGDVP